MKVWLNIYIRLIRPQKVVEHDLRRTWRRQLRAPRDAPLGGDRGDTTALDGGEPTIDILPHRSPHPNGIHERKRFYLEEPRKTVGR